MCANFFFKQTKKMANFANSTNQRLTRTGPGRGGGALEGVGLKISTFLGPNGTRFAGSHFRA
jgi:hypothetical protein